jgi:hypothetical protein
MRHETRHGPCTVGTHEPLQETHIFAVHNDVPPRKRFGSERRLRPKELLSVADEVNDKRRKRGDVGAEPCSDSNSS